MANNGACIILVTLSIAAAQAFQAPLPASLRRHDSLDRARAHSFASARYGAPALPPRAAKQHRSLYKSPELSVAGVMELSRPIVAAPSLPPKSTAMARSTILGAAAFVVLMQVYQAGAAVTPVSWTLLLHGLAGAVGGMVAVFTDSTIFERSEQAIQGLWQSVKFTAITKAVNSITFAYLQDAVAALSLGTGGIALAATGNGVVATLIQGWFAGQSREARDSFFQENVGRNVLLFNTFWFTYFGICAISPAIPVTYTGIGVAGALAGVVSQAAHSVGFSWKNLRHAWAKLRLSFKKGVTWRGGLQTGVLFVVYQGVFSAFTSA
jgi:hypothetical protein